LRRISGTGKAKAKFEKYHSKRWELAALVLKNIWFLIDIIIVFVITD
jgi:hypothetical protein